MSANYLKLIKQVTQHLETIIEKTDSLVFWPITWDDSYFLLRELETAVEQIDALSEQLEPIYFSGMTHRTRTLLRILKMPTNALMHFHGTLVRFIACLRKKVQGRITKKMVNIYQLN